MAVFIVVFSDVQLSHEAAVLAAYPDAYRIAPNVFTIQADGAARAVSQNIGIRSVDAQGQTIGTIEDGAVIELAPSYWGLMNASLWTWLKASFEGGE